MKTSTIWFVLFILLVASIWFLGHLIHIEIKKNNEIAAELVKAGYAKSGHIPCYRDTNCPTYRKGNSVYYIEGGNKILYGGK